MTATDKPVHQAAEQIGFGDSATAHAAALSVANQSARKLSAHDLTGPSGGLLLPTYQMDHHGITFTTVAANDRAGFPADGNNGKQTTCAPTDGGNWLSNWIGDNVPVLGSPLKAAKIAAEAAAKANPSAGCDKD
ncbi:MAG TPA: hypothetical protein V6D22_23595 [Candidatus Obscuribacterales bacterium]